MRVLQTLFFKLHVDFPVSFTAERLPSSHSAIKPRSVGVSVMVVLLEGHRIST